MQLNFTGAALAGSVWLLAAIVAWPWHHPAAAACILIGYALLLVVPVALDAWDSSGPDEAAAQEPVTVTEE